MKTFTLILITFFGFILTTSAQNFMPGFDIFSHKMPAYLTLNDGTKIEGEIDRLNRKRNNISGIKMIIDSKEVESGPEDVKEMYLPAN